MRKLIIFLTFFVSISEGFSSFNVDENDKCPFSLCAVVTQDEFLDHFEKTGVIGGGGEARVYSVKNRNTEESYALILQRELRIIAPPDYREDLIQRLIENQEINPHQGKIYGYFWIMNPNYPYEGGAKKGVLPFTNVKDSHLFDETYADDPSAIPYRHEAMLMELGEGDLDSQYIGRY